MLGMEQQPFRLFLSTHPPQVGNDHYISHVSLLFFSSCVNNDQMLQIVFTDKIEISNVFR